MERNIITVLLVLCIGGAVYSQVPGLGPCFNATAQSSLNLTQYLGKWYEITKLPSYFELEQVCVTANYSLKEDGHIKVFNQGKVNGNNVTSVGDAYAPVPSEPAKLDVKFPGGKYGPYWVLDTDYTSYTIVLSCNNVATLAHLQFAWVLSRTPTLEQSVLDRLIQKFKDNGVPVSKLKPTLQNCTDNTLYFV